MDGAQGKKTARKRKALAKGAGQAASRKSVAAGTTAYVEHLTKAVYEAVFKAQPTQKTMMMQSPGNSRNPPPRRHGPLDIVPPIHPSPKLFFIIAFEIPPPDDD
jgi:hypothetical protein